MSEALTVLNNPQEALAAGGVGLGTKLFRLKPATLELVQKSTRQENVKIGQFRCTSTNEHYETMKLVFLVQPQEQRQYYVGDDFKKENKKCFSLDNITPHPRATNPPAMRCATCPKGDLNWEKWRTNKVKENLPPCHKFWHLVVVDRGTKMVYYLNVKGTGITHFEQKMQDFARLLSMATLNVQNENKQTIAANAVEGATQQALKPLPNIFDVVFDVYPIQLVKGGPYVIDFKNFAMIREAERKDFGDLYLDFVERKNQGNVVDSNESEESLLTEAAVETAAGIPAEHPAGQPIEGVILGPSGDKQGTTSATEERITI